MRTLNVLAIALLAPLVVIAALLARHANGAEGREVWLQSLETPMQELIVFRRKDGFIEEAARFADHAGVIGLIRLPGEAMPADRIQIVTDEAVFRREAAKRFEADGAALSPLPLSPSGRLVGGFVARVATSGGQCDFAVVGFSPNGARDSVEALARVIICDPTGGLTSPDVRLAGLLALAEGAQ